MARMLRVGLAQTGPVLTEGFDAGLAGAEAMFARAAERGVQLLLFSELFLSPFFPNRLEKEFDRFFLSLDGPEIARLRAMAASARSRRAPGGSSSP